MDMGLFNNIFKKEKRVKEDNNMNELSELIDEAKTIKKDIKPIVDNITQFPETDGIGEVGDTLIEEEVKETPKSVPAQNLMTIVGNQVIEFNVEQSSIDGKGMIAKSHIPKNSMLSEAYQLDETGLPKNQIFPFGFFTNHSSKNSNAFLATFVDKLYIVTSKEIVKGEEILINYDEYPHLEDSKTDWIK